MKSIDNFDLSQNVKFSTYAVPMIIGEIRRYLRDNNSIRVSRSLRDIAYKALLVRDKLIKDNNKEPTVSQIAKELNKFLDSYGYKEVSEIIGLAHKKSVERNFRTTSVPPNVDLDKCIKCGQCKVSCVYDAIEITDKLSIDNGKCFGCGLCATKCPKNALTIQYN